MASEILRILVSDALLLGIFKLVLHPKFGRTFFSTVKYF
jgi:hypothetical protein